MLKDSKLVMSTAGKIFFLHKLYEPLILCGSSSLICLRILVWLIMIEKAVTHGAMTSILSEQSFVLACSLGYALLW